MARNSVRETSSVMSNDQSSYSKSGMITFTLSMIASFGILIYVSFLSGGVDLKELPQEKPAAAEGAAPAVAPADPNAAGAETQADANAQAPAPDVKAPEASPTPEAAH